MGLRANKGPLLVGVDSHVSGANTDCVRDNKKTVAVRVSANIAWIRKYLSTGDDEGYAPDHNYNEFDLGDEEYDVSDSEDDSGHSEDDDTGDFGYDDSGDSGDDSSDWSHSGHSYDESRQSEDDKKSGGTIVAQE